MVLLDPVSRDTPLLFSRNRLNLTSVRDADHGGPPGTGRGADWAREVLRARGLAAFDLRLLTQPRFLGYCFNPVSFWLAFDGKVLRAVIAEVSNTFGDRHSYVCHPVSYTHLDVYKRQQLFCRDLDITHAELPGLIVEAALQHQRHLQPAMAVVRHRLTRRDIQQPQRPVRPL